MASLLFLNDSSTTRPEAVPLGFGQANQFFLLYQGRRQGCNIENICMLMSIRSGAMNRAATDI